MFLGLSRDIGGKFLCQSYQEMVVHVQSLLAELASGRYEFTVLGSSIENSNTYLDHIFQGITDVIEP